MPQQLNLGIRLYAAHPGPGTWFFWCHQLWIWSLWQLGLFPGLCRSAPFLPQLTSHHSSSSLTLLVPHAVAPISDLGEPLGPLTWHSRHLLFISLQRLPNSTTTDLDLLELLNSSKCLHRLPPISSCFSQHTPSVLLHQALHWPKMQ